MPNTAVTHTTIRPSNPSRFDAEPSPVLSRVPLAPPQTSFRAAQQHLTRAALRHDARIEIGFDTATGRYRLSATQGAARL